jgi:hypothetical protein
MLELFRQYRRRSATRLGVAFASLWLAFAAVPCSALEALGADLGHAHAAAVASAPTAADHDCPHCPPEQPATATPGDCVGLDEAVVTKVAASDLALAAPPSWPTLALHADPVGALVPHRADGIRPPTIPLNLRFCTFLE